MINIQKRNKYILRLRKKGLTLSMIKILVKEKFGETISRERINQIIKRSNKKRSLK
jgi:intein-encoded DNA endonuclease-like protein